MNSRSEFLGKSYLKKLLKISKLFRKILFDISHLNKFKNHRFKSAKNELKYYENLFFENLSSFSAKSERTLNTRKYLKMKR